MNNMLPSVKAAHEEAAKIELDKDESNKRGPPPISDMEKYEETLKKR
jgi:ribosome biogenesis ATPase